MSNMSITENFAAQLTKKNKCGIISTILWLNCWLKEVAQGERDLRARDQRTTKWWISWSVKSLIKNTQRMYTSQSDESCEIFSQGAG